LDKILTLVRRYIPFTSSINTPEVYIRWLKEESAAPQGNSKEWRSVSKEPHLPDA
jgi:hypothetical protein